MVLDAFLRQNKLVTSESTSTCAADVLRNIKEGARFKDYTCTYAGTSQYADGFSSSACGLVTMNFIQQILTLEADGASGDTLASKLMQKEFQEVSPGTTETELAIEFQTGNHVYLYFLAG